jgi:hypothetical protein
LLVGIVDRRNTPPEDGHHQKQRQLSAEATASTNVMPPRTMEEATGWQHQPLTSIAGREITVTAVIVAVARFDKLQ